MIKKLLVVIMMLAFAGCASLTKVGTIGDRYDVYDYSSTHMVAPSTQITMIHDTKVNDLATVGGSAGVSILGVLAQPAADAYAAHQIGRGIGASGTVENTTITNDSNSDNDTKLDVKNDTEVDVKNTNKNKNLNTNKNTSTNSNINKNDVKNTNTNTNKNTSVNTNTNKNDVKNTNNIKTIKNNGGNNNGNGNGNGNGNNNGNGNGNGNGKK